MLKRILAAVMCWIGLAGCTMFDSGKAKVVEKPNVLFISVDDMNNSLACYGHSEMITPNIDRIAKMGVKFDRAYCQFPLCSPSRVSLMTGLRPDQTHVYDLKLNFRDVLPDAVTLPQMFMRNGYYAARVGKIYHYGNPGQIGTPGLDDPASWNEALNPRGREKDEEKLLANHTPGRGLGSALCFQRSEGTDEELTDGIVATETIRLLKEHKDRPFFIAAGFYRPHCPYVAPKKYFDLYPLDKVTIPPGPYHEIRSAPASAMESVKPWPWFGATEEQVREAKQAYLATISFVDAQIGRVLDALEKEGLTDDTIIVFWSDHGYHFGEHGLIMKMSLWEESARVPMLIAAPWAKGNGMACARTVELLDIYPTLAELAGLTPPAGLGGASVAKLLEDPKAKWDKPAFTQLWRGKFSGHSIRTERWRYTEWDGGEQGTQLYDHERDPHELKNLAGEAGYQDIEAQLRAMVRKNWDNEYIPVKSGQ